MGCWDVGSVVGDFLTIFPLFVLPFRRNCVIEVGIRTGWLVVNNVRCSELPSL